jgi:transcriptional regulator with XRE-family HTH domain
MKKFKELRRMAGWTQTKTARASRINRAKLSQAECGEIELNHDEETAIRRVLIRAIRNRVKQINCLLTDPSAREMAEQ